MSTAPPASPTTSMRRTPWHVRWIDRLAGAVITGGGLTVIATLMGICVFLVWVVAPLFSSVSVDPPRHVDLGRVLSGRELRLLDMDESGVLIAALDDGGRLLVVAADTGQLIEQHDLLPPDRRVMVAARSRASGHAALALDDGTFRLGRIHFTDEFFDRSHAAELGLGQDPGSRAPARGGIASWTGTGEIRLTRLAQEWPSPAARYREHEAALINFDYRAVMVEERLAAEVLAGMNAQGVLFAATIRRTENLLTGETLLQPRWRELPGPPADDLPDYLLINDLGNQVIVAWKDGRLWRYELPEQGAPAIVERTRLTADARLLTLEYLLGSRSLVAGDSRGGLQVWFCAPEEGPQAPADGRRLVPGHRLTSEQGPITALAVSPQDRCVASADEQGRWVLQHVTTERVLAESAAGGGAIRSLQFAPRGDALLALDESTRLSVWPLHKPHPEISFAALLGRVWYENYPEPSHTWQSSGGSDDFEPKFSLVPLMFGTLKATAYSMFFAVPIAVLSAIYTSQFLSSHTRNLVKPAIEMMASLPSVVLGFIAALVLAPIVESRLLGALGLVILIPLAVWLAGHAWQLLPAPLAARLGGGARLLWAGGVILAAALLSFQLAPKVERLLFSGDIMGWLNQTVGSGAALWGLLTLPLALLVSFRLRSRVQMHIARGRLVTSGLLSEGAVELLSGLAALAAAAWMAWLVSAGLDALGLDLRGEVVGTYVQRNTLVVGFVMGFAVIPIIYTISEDALSAVPQHLKAGSLACGASVWQTALRVVLPIAGSGIFSATMIGLGRAAGETMIVVMAAGNTPIIDVNPFNGLRALSANIAVELPEAVKDGSLYRVLFLAGLALFGLTFVINTVAEIVRLRLRKRAHQL